ncbi:Aminoglycoside N(6')-acetyltransferase type 1 [Roseobacter fucihabitans]|uniref:Aminoglycoside N(6')-acetyltransferase type 1 n=1 Tax=Roseobacter fucihabitans TaxID=1537242 RepID=A0ABZ2BPU5_9RHOB|nr:GNAT family N-acetyltransferase [Roseobacter litoralis]MBC6963546.1 Aminoglycoside N(6')-acetyltransferase type 1 [Roseobacter litoralis]
MNIEKREFYGMIRPAREHDLEVVRDMISSLASHHGDVATLTSAQLARDILGPRPWVRVLLAECRGVCIGYVALCPLSKMQFGMRGMDLLNLYVVPDARRTGVAKALIKASQDVAEQEKCDFLAVGTHPDNTVAQDIYRALGFDSLEAPGPRFSIALKPQV